MNILTKFTISQRIICGCIATLLTVSVLAFYTQQKMAGIGDAAQAIKNNPALAAQTITSLLSDVKWIISFSVGIMLIFGTLGSVIFIRSINGSLDEISSKLSASAQQVAAAASQVAQSSERMAEGTSQQASSLEETSASLEEMSSMTRQNADNAEQARANSDRAGTAAESGEATTRAMGRELTQRLAGMNDAIQKIKASADHTAKILKTIDEIAFQTNLLALNAAVEAARAGEAGKGFAVVAEEVRSLAQRSAEAARNTAALIEESQLNADNGVKVSAEVAAILKKSIEVEIARSFAGTVDAVKNVKQRVGEVAVASGEQAKGVEQINIAVSEMDKVTQSNAANAEEMASASEELSAQAYEMQDMVSELIRMVRGASDVRSAAAVRVRETAPDVSIRTAKSAAAPRKITGMNRIATLNGQHAARVLSRAK
jgi:methyl-accepting chemotaxis protein